MSGGVDRRYKVLTLLGITAAAAATYAFWVLQSSNHLNNTEKSKKAKKSAERTDTDKLDNKSEQSKQSVVRSNTDIDQETKSKEDFRDKGEDISSDMTSVYTLPAAKPQAKTLGDYVEVVSDDCLEKAIRDKTQTAGKKEQSPSWSQLVEEEEEIQSGCEDMITHTGVKSKVSMQTCKEECSTRIHHDSGVVSPQNDMLVKDKKNGIIAESKGGQKGGGQEESLNNTKHEEDLDGGLGSSECGDDLIQGLKDVTITNEKAPGMHKVKHVSGEDRLGGDQRSQQTATDLRNDEKLPKTPVKNQRQTTGGSDSGQGSEADDGMRMSYQFYIPNHLCGRLIGRLGENVMKLKQATQCVIQLHERTDTFRGRYSNSRRKRTNESEVDPYELQICAIEGTRNGIDRCLELLREKFPLQQFQDLTLEQINLPYASSSAPESVILGAGSSSCSLVSGGGGTLIHEEQSQNQPSAIFNSQQTTTPLIPTPTQLGLDQGAMHEVYVSAIVSGGHVFLQQPNHPTHQALSRLETCMFNVNSQLAVPEVPREAIESGLVCVANWSQQWYRVQVVKYDRLSDTCYVRFLDYGGYYTFTPSDLKQIRSDFLSLPFQALEVYLGNVVPPLTTGITTEWPVESAVVLEELVANQIISGRMLGVTENYIPIVHLYGWVNTETSKGSETNSQTENSQPQRNQQPRLLNRELVDRGVALWTEHTIAAST